MKHMKIAAIVWLPILLGIGGIGLFSLSHHPALVKALLGRGRILDRRLDATVFVNSTPFAGAMCFDEPSARGHRGRLILWMPSSGSPYGREVFIIDPGHHDVGQPNSSDEDYRLYLGSFLAQSDSGYATVSFKNGVKSYGEDPHLAVNSSSIDFTMPSRSTFLPNSKIQVRWTPGASSIGSWWIVALVALALAIGWMKRIRDRAALAAG